MSLKPPWLVVAEAELGVREVPGPGDEPRVIGYHAATTLHATDDEVPWCSAFVCWVFEQVDILPTRSARARSWMTWGQAIRFPPLGAVVVISRGTGDQGHVGFLVEREGDSIYLLGGNQGDAVSVAKFEVSRVLAYRWPA